MKTVLLVRHGESAANAGGATEHVALIPLTEKGHTQAKAFANSVNRRPDLIVMSEFIRTQETARPTIGRFPDVPTAIWPIHEFTYLRHRGVTTAEERRPLAAAFWDKADPAHVDGEGAESFHDLIARIRDMQKRINDLPDGSFTIIFCHGQVMQTLRFLLSQPEMSPADIMKVFRKTEIETPFHNCATLRLSVADGAFTIESEKPDERKDRPKNPRL